jgi:hypothetical protein
MDSGKLARRGSKVIHLRVASILAILLHWVQPLPTGAWGKEDKSRTSYGSNVESAVEQVAQTVLEACS